MVGLSAANAQLLTSDDGRAVGATATAQTSELTEFDRTNAKSRMPILTDPSQVPGLSEFESMAYGTGGHPFTTRAPWSSPTIGKEMQFPPYKQTGKLWMRFGADWYVCTASVINKGLLVTAAHCVWNYGNTAGYADEVRFEPARHGTVAPYALRYGIWTASNWWVPTVYANGTDTCTTAGVVCANDVAIVVLNTGPAPFTGQHIASVVGRYGYYSNNDGYASFLGKQAVQLTQLGYPQAFESGLRMIRTDSLGYQADPYNVIIGSNQTGGSSGGPWLQNFGRKPATTTSVPSFDDDNRVSAVTSWGYVSSTIKVQGASRFANNPAFPAPGNTNVAALISAACTSSPANC
jgi:V8-like Glu-specific endopeptidase